MGDKGHLYSYLYLMMLTLDNWSTFLGLWSLNCLHSGSQQNLISGRQNTDGSGLAWEPQWDGNRWHDMIKQKDILPSFRRLSQPPHPPFPPGCGLSLTTAQAASWGEKVGSPWCTRKPRCQSSSSRQSPCTSAAPAVLGPATHMRETHLSPCKRGRPALPVTPHAFPGSIQQVLACPYQGEEVAVFRWWYLGFFCTSLTKKGHF